MWTELFDRLDLKMICTTPASRPSPIRKRFLGTCNKYVCLVCWTTNASICIWQVGGPFDFLSTPNARYKRSFDNAHRDIKAHHFTDLRGVRAISQRKCDNHVFTNWYGTSYQCSLLKRVSKCIKNPRLHGVTEIRIVRYWKMGFRKCTSFNFRIYSLIQQKMHGIFLHWIS